MHEFSKTIAVNGERLRYLRTGSGEPLLLIHSLGTGAWMWREQLRHWGQRFDVIAVDARGHGASTHNGPATVSEIAGDLAQVIRQLALGPVQVVAISMGGPIASYLHQADPSSISRLVIADSFARQGSAGADRVRQLESVLQKSSMAEYGLGYAQGTLHPQTPKSVLDELVSSIAVMDKAAYLETARSVFTSDVAQLMSEFRMPVKIVVGDRDTRTPLAFSEDVRSLIPSSTLEIIPGAAHLANLDNPPGFHNAIDEFLLGASK